MEEMSKLGDSKKHVQDHFKKYQPKDYEVIMKGDRCPVCGSDQTDIVAFSDMGFAAFDCINGHEWEVKEGELTITESKEGK